MATTTTKEMSREALAQIEGEHRAAEQEVARLRGILSGQVGARVTRTEQVRRLTPSGPQTVEVDVEHYETRAVSRLEALQAQRGLLAAEERLLELEVEMAEARQAFAEAQRIRRAEVVARYDAEAAKELAALVSATDVIAGKWRAFEEANRRRDVEFLATGDRTAFAMARYADRVFGAFADTGDGSQWARFKALQADAR